MEPARTYTHRPLVKSRCFLNHWINRSVVFLESSSILGVSGASLPRKESSMYGHSSRRKRSFSLLFDIFLKIFVPFSSHWSFNCSSISSAFLFFSSSVSSDRSTATHIFAMNSSGVNTDSRSIMIGLNSCFRAWSPTSRIMLVFPNLRGPEIRTFCPFLIRRHISCIISSRSQKSEPVTTAPWRLFGKKSPFFSTMFLTPDRKSRSLRAFFLSSKKARTGNVWIMQPDVSGYSCSIREKSATESAWMLVSRFISAGRRRVRIPLTTCLYEAAGSSPVM